MTLIDFKYSLPCLFTEFYHWTIFSRQTVLPLNDAFTLVWKFLKYFKGPWGSHFISAYRLSDWMRLLDLDVGETHFSYAEWPFNFYVEKDRKTALQKIKNILANIFLFKIMKPFGAIYLLSAKKKSLGMTLIPPVAHIKPRLISVPLVNFSSVIFLKNKNKDKHNDV